MSLGAVEMNTLSWIVDGSFSTRLTWRCCTFSGRDAAAASWSIVGGALLRGASARVRYALNVAAMLLMAICLPVTFCVLEMPKAVVDRTGGPAECP